ncbi:MAG: 4-hydroxybenzoate octaprenyltransferase [SAR202 cluster bacterium]|nr:4-hydroxybenzoate octaprenyltransferase [SAR202 cluster bacterium]MQG39280.1 4-hydroxybenzoate octaprenyltransferase [SAR202 cluster bacterium]
MIVSGLNTIFLIKVFNKFIDYLKSIRFEETIFSLPFAFVGAILSRSSFLQFETITLIILAMIGARTFGMSANRVIDLKIDSLNPRTSSRHLPAGLIHPSELVVVGLIGLACLFFASWKLNFLSFILSPIAGFYLAIYPFSKRFTWLSSLILGGALALAPAGGWIGAAGTFSYATVILSTGVVFWATAFDIIYHTQDREFYIKHGLYSFAQKFGLARSFTIAKFFDLIAILSFISLGFVLELSYVYFLGCFISSLGILLRYYFVTPLDLSKIPKVFMFTNGYFSFVFFIFTILTVT